MDLTNRRHAHIDKMIRIRGPQLPIKYTDALARDLLPGSPSDLPCGCWGRTGRMRFGQSPARFGAGLLRPDGFPGQGGFPISPTARPGILHLPDAAAGSPPVGAQPRRGDSGPDLTQGEVQPFSSLQPTTAPDLTAALPSTMPSTMPVIEGDQYLTLGGVVMVVNGRPIFADKVLRRDINILREYARQMSLPEFEESARQQIERTVNELEGDELEIAAAERTLDPKDIQLAKILTAEWSKHQIGEAGGSEQVARIRADASGEDFQDQEDDKYHYYLTQLYYFKKIRPQIEIGPEDERRYYFAHIDEFTTPAQASIILIEADPADLNGNRQAAIDKLRDIRKRALGGEDFAEYARNQNDLPGAGRGRRKRRASHPQAGHVRLQQGRGPGLEDPAGTNQ